ncbi:MAG TPA: nickel pincer cofactor biosynthesis protein LarC [Candidatus Aminicenantes bacterium]|nr:nickel pincer cofactor biosynthesis protein LarC [Candidatus Aminicenantes bacterium]
MARELLFQTECGASGDMILASLIDLLDCGAEFTRTFEAIGLDVRVTVADAERGHLRCRQVTVEAPPAAHAATWPEIEAFLAAVPLSARVRADAALVFQTIFSAEAAVHGEELRHVHLHEVGAADSLVDILGFCWLWEKLERCPIVFTTLVTGFGSVRTRHGVLPVPPPAVLRMVQGLACRAGEIEDELLTPTAAAILTTFGRQAGPGRTARPLRTGCGCGHKTFPAIANLLRAVLEERDASPAADGVWVLECLLDDLSPELLAHAADRIAQAGALDVFIATGLMKKGRPGFQLTALCAPEAREAVAAAIFAETSAIGLRQRLSDRIVLPRETRSVRVAGVDVRLKTAVFQGRTANVKPEFEDVRRLADALGLPAKEALRMVLGVIHEEHGPGKD